MWVWGLTRLGSPEVTQGRRETAPCLSCWSYQLMVIKTHSICYMAAYHSRMTLACFHAALHVGTHAPGEPGGCVGPPGDSALPVLLERALVGVNCRCLGGPTDLRTDCCQC